MQMLNGYISVNNLLLMFSPPDLLTVNSNVSVENGVIKISGSNVLTAANLSTYALTSYVNTSISNLLDCVQTTMNTLAKISNSIGNDHEFFY